MMTINSFLIIPNHNFTTNMSMQFFAESNSWWTNLCSIASI